MGCEPPSLTLWNSRPKTCRRGFRFLPTSPFQGIYNSAPPRAPSTVLFQFARRSLPFLSPPRVFLLRLRHVSGSYCGGLFMRCPRCLRSHIAPQMFAPRGKEPAVLDHLAVLFQGKLSVSNFLWIWVQSTEANWRNKSLGRAVVKKKKKKKVCLLCPRRSVNSAVRNAFMPAFVYFYKGIFYGGCARLSYM